ncbi:MAG: hypothetical protein ACRBN8_34125 [Nannocystales bacterium]
MRRLLIVTLVVLELPGCKPMDTCDSPRLEAGLNRWEAQQALEHPSRLYRPPSHAKRLEDTVLGACPGAPEFLVHLMTFNTAFREHEHTRSFDPVRTEEIMSQMQAVTQKHCNVPSLTEHLGPVPAQERPLEAQRVCNLPLPMAGPSVTLCFAFRDRGVEDGLALRHHRTRSGRGQRKARVVGIAS